MAVVIQAIEDLGMTTPVSYSEDELTLDKNRFYYGPKEALYWLSTEGRKIMEDYGVPTVLISKALRNKEVLPVLLKACKAGG